MDGSLVVGATNVQQNLVVADIQLECWCQKHCKGLICLHNLSITHNITIGNTNWTNGTNMEKCAKTPLKQASLGLPNTTKLYTSNTPIRIPIFYTVDYQCKEKYNGVFIGTIRVSLPIRDMSLEAPMCLPYPAALHTTLKSVTAKKQGNTQN